MRCRFPFLNCLRTRIFALVFALPMAAGAGVLDTIGVTALRAQHPGLTGKGVKVGQIEFSDTGALDFQVRPGSANQPSSLFTYISSRGVAGDFANNVGTESAHANSVADNFYDRSSGVVPDVRHVFNYDSDFFVGNIIGALRATPAKVINQSFAFGHESPGTDQRYDNYISLFGAIVVSGIGNGGAVMSPAICFNGIGVGAYGGGSSTGPTSDGRSKPDLVAPAGATSFSAPLVSGAAAILVQAGRKMHADKHAATDPRTIKALLLNGAEKPGDWTHSTTAPLDARYGAGVLNVFNSYETLTAGRHRSSLDSATIGAETGWDLRALKSGAASEAANHYRFTLEGTAPFTLTSTLVWNRHYNRAAINDLDLRLFDANGNLVAESGSDVDNVEHLFLGGLAAGTYDLAVVKHGGATGPGVVNRKERYSLAWDFDPSGSGFAAAESARSFAAAPAAVPEPGTAGLAASGLLALLGVFLRKRRARD